MAINKRIVSVLFFGALYLGASTSVIAEDQWADGHVDEHEHHHGAGSEDDSHEHHHKTGK